MSEKSQNASESRAESGVAHQLARADVQEKQPHRTQKIFGSDQQGTQYPQRNPAWGRGKRKWSKSNTQNTSAEESGRKKMQHGVGETMGGGGQRNTEELGVLDKASQLNLYRGYRKKGGALNSSP